MFDTSERIQVRKEEIISQINSLGLPLDPNFVIVGLGLNRIRTQILFSNRNNPLWYRFNKNLKNLNYVAIATRFETLHCQKAVDFLIENKLVSKEFWFNLDKINFQGNY